jgi:hypothetical protein
VVTLELERLEYNFLKQPAYGDSSLTTLTPLPTSNHAPGHNNQFLITKVWHILYDDLALLPCQRLTQALLLFPRQDRLH